MRRRVLLVAGGAIIVLACAYALLASRESPNSAPASVALASFDLPAVGGFERALTPYDWQFPADYGSHPAFQTEWWYYTGTLADGSGRRFGYQFTVFRRALRAIPVESDSEWRANQLFMAHFTVTDVAGGQFFQAQRYSRGAAGLAGATVAPEVQVWLDDWQVRVLDESVTQTRITASSDRAQIDLILDAVKGPVLQGEGGLSRKSDQPGYASYYYSLPRLSTRGTIRIDGKSYALDGLSWMDHEFGSQSLPGDVQGWDWFGLHLDDGRDLMVGQIRLTDGSLEAAYQGALVQADGTYRILAAAEFSIARTRTWVSSQTGVEYPAAWEIAIDAGSADELRLTVVPLIADQELREGAIVYWEGAVEVAGDAHGSGYAELTGYGDPMRGRF